MIRERRLALALTIIAACLHVAVFLKAGALWRDEVQSLSVATAPSLIALWGFMGKESFPILYPFLLRSWDAIRPPGDIWLRLPGLLIGLAVLGALWRGLQVTQRRAPLLSISLFGLCAAALRWGDSVRAYGLGTFLMLASCGLIWQAVEDPAPARILAAATAATLSVQCLYQNAFLVLALCLGGAAVALRRAKPRVLAAMAAVGLAAALSLCPYAGPITASRDWFQRTQSSLPWLLARLFAAASGGTESAALAWTAAAGAALICGTSGILARRPKPENGLELFSLTALATGTAGSLIFHLRAGIQVQPWHFIPLLAFAAFFSDILLSSTADKSRSRWARPVFCAAALAAAAASLPAALTASRLRQTNVDLIAERLAVTAAPQDLIIVHPWFCGVTFQRYYRGRAPWTTLPPLSDYSLNRTDLLREQLALPRPIEPVLTAMGKVLARGGTVWLTGPVAPPPDGVDPPRPPPLQRGGGVWSEESYSRAFSLQAGRFLETHSLIRESFPRDGGGSVSELEDLPLLAVRGWRTRPR